MLIYYLQRLFYLKIINMRNNPELINAPVPYEGYVNPAIESVYLTPKMLADREREIAAHISQDYAGEEIVFICVMKGAVCFTIDLMRYVKNPIILDFITVLSYGPGAKSTGAVKLKKDIDSNIKGKHVLLLEDILDSGRTLTYLLEHFQKQEPASLNVCALLDKPEKRKYPIPLKYNGFTIPDIFIVGYGMDYDQRFRDLPYMGIVKESYIKEGKV